MFSKRKKRGGRGSWWTQGWNSLWGGSILRERERERGSSIMSPIRFVEHLRAGYKRRRWRHLGFEGGDTPTPDGLLTDGISIGALHAIARGIVVIASGGNNGPRDHTVTNVAPWVLTVAASSMDREITNNVALGSKNQIVRVIKLFASPFFFLIEIMFGSV